MNTRRTPPGLLLLTLGGIGFARWRPALSASAVSTVVLLALESALPPAPEARFAVLVILFSIVFLLSILALRTCVPRNDVDQTYVVVDEFLGMLVALAPQMLDDNVRVLPALCAFAVFRVIDSWKPLGIRFIDKQNTPVAVLLDDVVAGVYTALLIAGLAALFQSSAMLSAS